jgi:hypothetical protein
MPLLRAPHAPATAGEAILAIGLTLGYGGIGPPLVEVMLEELGAELGPVAGLAVSRISIAGVLQLVAFLDAYASRPVVPAAPSVLIESLPPGA